MSEADDLKLIPGIGQRTEARLREAGIRTYAQLAELALEELKEVVPGLPEKRFPLADWISEARTRAFERVETIATSDIESVARNAAPGRTDGFRVELPLDEQGRVRETRVTHLESGEHERWTGFDEVSLMGFLRQYASDRASEIDRPRLPTPSEASERAAGQPHGAEASRLVGSLRLRELKTVVPDQPEQSMVLRDGQPFTVRVVLDLTKVQVRRDVRLSYTVAVYASGLIRGCRRLIGEDRGTLSIDAEAVPIDMNTAGLPRDAYVLRAFVTLRPVETSGTAPAAVTALLEQGPIKVE